MTEKFPGPELRLIGDQQIPQQADSVGEDGVIFRSPEDERHFDIGANNLTEVATTKDEVVAEVDPALDVTSVAQTPETTPGSPRRSGPPKRRIRHTNGRDHGYSHEGSFGESVPFELR